MSNFEIGNTPRSIKPKEHDVEAKKIKPGHGRRNKAKQGAHQQTAVLSRQDDKRETHIIPSTPLKPDKRATFDVLPKFETWAKRAIKETDSQRKWNRGSTVLNPRGDELQTPRLGGMRSDFQEITQKLLKSVEGATAEQIEEALQQLDVVLGSSVNLANVALDCESKARVARHESDELQRRAKAMDEQAALFRKLSESGAPQCQKVIDALKAELEHRATLQPQHDEVETVEYGQIKEAKLSSGDESSADESSGDEVFGRATLELNKVLEQLTRLDEKFAAAADEKRRVDKAPDAVPSTELAAIELGTVLCGDKTARKVAQHQRSVGQLKELLAEEEAALEKWSKMSQASNVSSAPLKRV
jgi:hypothetical protein